MASRTELAGDDGAVEREIDMLSYQVEEIGSAELTDSDEDELEREHAEAANATLILEQADCASQALTES